MKSIIPILFILSFGQLVGQEKKDNVNFALLNYELTNKKLDIDSQEKFLNTILSIGDKSIILDEIFKKLLFSKNYSYEDSIIKSLFTNLNYSDSIAVSKLPRIADDWRQIPHDLIKIGYMGQAYIDKTTLSEVYLNTQKDQPAKFPNLPNIFGFEEYSDPVLSYLKVIHDYVKWYVNYPDEFAYFMELLKGQSIRFSGKDANTDIVSYLNHVKQEAINNQSIDKENIPPPISVILEYYNNQKKHDLLYLEKCNENQIMEFISDAYTLVFKVEISEKTLQDMTAYVKENKVYDPELIYFALLLSKYE